MIHWILGLSVWCVYLADRLFDSYRAKGFANATLRLRFTKKHFPKLIVTAGVATIVNMFLIARYAPAHLILHGLATGGLLALYYAFRFSSSGRAAVVVPREVMCGVVFAIGSTVACFSYSSPEATGIAFFLSVAMLAIVCSANCILISVWERVADLSCGDLSIATAGLGIPPEFRRLIIPLLLLYAVAAFADPWQIHLATGLSALALAAMVRFEDKFSPELLRALADFVVADASCFPRLRMKSRNFRSQKPCR